MKKCFLLTTLLVLTLTGCKKDKEEEPILSLDKDSIEFRRDGSPISDNVINITANTEWAAYTDKQWCTISPISGKGSGSITVTANPFFGNGTPEVATITVRLKNGAITKTVMATQQILSATQTELCFNADGSATTIDYFYITATSDWEIIYDNEADKQWLTVPGGSYNGSRGFIVTVTSSDIARKATLTIKMGELSLQLTVQQSPTNIFNFIADPNFKNYCQQFDTNSDNVLTIAEALAVEKIELVKAEISSLAGIEYFTNLTELNCASCQLTSLDVSNNEALKMLICYSNQLTSLDLKNNLALEKLSCDYNKLTSLDLSNNRLLKRLSCSNNQFTSLDMSNNTALQYLTCSNSKLTSLNVKSNIALEELICNYTQLTSLDVSNNKALKMLTCSGNQLTSLDVKNNIALEDLNCSSNQLTKLDLSSNTALKYIGCFSNQLTSLDLPESAALTTLACSQNQLTSLDVKNNIALEKINCSTNKFTSLDVSNKPALIELHCYQNQLTSLIVKNNTSMKMLNGFSNQITSLDLSSNPALAYVDCSYSKITSLNVSGCTLLQSLYCQYNRFSNLDISSCKSLKRLNCETTVISLVISVWQGFNESNFEKISYSPSTSFIPAP